MIQCCLHKFVYYKDVLRYNTTIQEMNPCSVIHHAISSFRLGNSSCV